MARKKQETLVLFPEIAQVTQKMTDAQFGALMRAVFAYRFGGESYDGDDLAVDIAFRTVMGQIERYLDVCTASKSDAQLSPVPEASPEDSVLSEAHTPPIREKPADKPPEDVDFGRFWAKYPKKVGKQAAKKVFHRVNLPVETLLSAIERQKGSLQWSRENGQFIPNPATWLAQGRWEDELQTKQEVSGQAGADAYSALDWSKCGIVV